MINTLNTIITIVKLILAVAPFVILAIINAKVNIPQADRSKQFAMPIIALVYAIVTMLTVNLINTGLIKLINNIPVWINKLGGLSWMPDVIGNFLKTCGKGIENFLAKINLGFWICFLSNILILVAYMYIKKICTKIIARSVKLDGKIHTKIAGIFYDFFTEKNIWCLKEGFVQVRGMLKVFYYSAIVLSALLMIVSRAFYFNGLITAVFYPVFGIIVVGELYFYLDGVTKREYSGYVLGEDEEAYRVVNYSLLRKFLRSIFGDKLLSENTSINNALAYDVTTDDIIRELEKNEDQKVVNFATYIKALNKTGASIDHNYLHSSLEMLEGNSVLFNNPFYNDLIPYAFYPMNRALLSHQKVLIVLGRHSIEEDIKEWVESGIEAVTNIPFMWNVGVLTAEEQQDLDIGIVTRSDVLDITMHNTNSEFLEKVGFVVILEPSKLISTAQIGLNLLVKKFNASEDKKVVYCLCDKNCDGLVDAMSHVLMTNITEVSATKKHLGTSSYMCWGPDDEYMHHRLVPNISRYLGFGTELSFAALKNQVSQTKWYGGEAFPVADIRWIDKQYYYDLTKYAGLPTSQEAMDDHFVTTPNFWSAKVSKNNYLTVEDEANNMFEVLRAFSTRTTEQGFINVISSEYLLKDYMADNASIFVADAKAIPCIVADYTRSNRNTILRLILMMSTYPVSSKILEKEFSLLGTNVYNLKKQLWYEIYNCYSDVTKTAELSDDYETAVEDVYTKTIQLGSNEWSSALINVDNSFNVKKGKMETTYSIVDPEFLRLCVTELRSAGYVTEDEKGERYYLGAELSGHVYQKYLPGQRFTFGGKYYEMLHLTADGQVLVRRAADHITGRQSYRQIREYEIKGTRVSEKIGAQQDIAGMKVVREFADICVSTSGYYSMSKYNDFTTARKILFEGKGAAALNREYRNKEILRIELPDFNGKLNDNVRYTIALLFNEVFKTIFAENQAYICAVTDDSFITETENPRPLTYSVKGNLKDNAIYIIEDSQLDLGLLVAAERNLERIFGIVFDYLDWHMDTLEKSLNPPADPLPPIIFTNDGSDNKSKKKRKKGFFSKIGAGIKKIFTKIKSWFKKKPKKGEETPTDVTPTGDTPVVPISETPTDDTPVVPTGDTEGTTGGDNAVKPEKVVVTEEEGTTTGEVEEGTNGETEGAADNAKKPKEKKKRRGIFSWFKRKKKKPAAETVTEEVVEEAVVIEDEAAVTIEEDGVVKETVETVEAPFENDATYSGGGADANKLGFSTERAPYHNRYYMLYGAEMEAAYIDLSGAYKYLMEMSVCRNPLKQARDGKNIAAFIEATYKPGKPDARYCDFCGTEIFGVEYETLGDGRDRCLSCGRTAIKKGEDFRKIFEDVKRNMESFFGIRINVGIKVEMVNSKTLHKRLGETFIPTSGSDGRVLGVAIHDKNGYTLLVENGSPRMASMLTMAHELTHIWQYLNWNDREICSKYGKQMRLEIYEGMAKWVEIQYAYLINEPATAKRSEIITSYRDDAYGYGFLRYRANYPFSLGTVITKPTPFIDVHTPLALEYCGAFTVRMPTDGINEGDIENGMTPNGMGGVIPGTTGAILGPIERNPLAVGKYAYNLLSETEKTAYDTILSAVKNFAPITSLEVAVSRDEAQKIVDYIYRDHPEIFWLQNGAIFHYDVQTNVVNHVEFAYCLTENEAAKQQEKIDTAVKAFLNGINDSMSDYEVTLHIYENLIKLIDYDTVGLQQQKATVLSPEVPDDLRSIYGALVNKKAVCAGYSKAFQYLLNLCGIECIYVTSERHAWNIIKLEGDYYHIDATWGDHSDTKNNLKNSDISYDCFCITTEEVLKLDMHTPEAILPLPECTATKCNYHRRHGLYFEAYDLDRVRSIVCESVKYNRLSVSLKFATDATFNEAKKNLVDDGKFRDIIQFAALKENVKLNNAYTYSTNVQRRTMMFHIAKM